MFMVDNNKEVEDFIKEQQSGIIELEPNTDEEKQIVEELMNYCLSTKLCLCQITLLHPYVYY
jgi:hypothetical protein